MIQFSSSFRVKLSGSVQWGRRFHFESRWANVEDCRTVIKSAWAVQKPGPLLMVVADRLKFFATFLDHWNKNTLQQFWLDIARN
ncbi:hypothetical protein ACOSP7_022027 [Xanthoceras sorbifolium]